MLTIWTIYQSPRDYPGKWVVRAHGVPDGPHTECHVCDSLDKARACIPHGLVRLNRFPQDEPQIYETWL